jgi:Repeat of unknown function (DUF5648)
VKYPQALFMLFTALVTSVCTSRSWGIDPLKFAPDVPATITAAEYESTRLKILSYTPQLERVWIDTNPVIRQLNVSFGYETGSLAFPTPPPPAESAFTLPGVAAGDYVLNLRDVFGRIVDTRRLSVGVTQARVPIKTFSINGYLTFVLATDKASAERLLAPNNAQDADSEFLAWPATGATPRNAKPVVRLKYVTEFGYGYYYTISSAEVGTLSGSQGWTNEGVTFRAIEPEFGACPFETQPIYRAFRGGMGGRVDLTHRYTPHVSAYRDWIDTYQWSGEGIAFCAPKR